MFCKFLVIKLCVFSYFTNAVRFAEKGYTPTNDDIFNAKVRTTGATGFLSSPCIPIISYLFFPDIVFETGGVEFTLVDVGGQRSERRKWLHCFDDVTTILFLVISCSTFF
jgi:hypothetical protein